MNPNWHNILTNAGARFSSENNDLLDFGDAAGELSAAQAATVAVPLTHLAQIAAQGDDAKSFLHNQLTSDINHLGENAAQHSAWCTAKGRMQASFIVWRQGEAYRLALASELLAPTQKRLQMFVLRAKVKLSDESDSQCLIGLSGPNAVTALNAAGLPQPAEILSTAEHEGSKVIRLDDQRYIVAAAAEQAGQIWAALGAAAKPAGVPAWRWLDVQAALPLVTGATKEEFVPQMADFEKMGGVSFHKGCYPGQEVVARTQYLGKVKRHLYRVVSSEPLAAGNDLWSPENLEQACGMVVSAAPAPQGGYAALAVIQSNFAHNVHLGSREGPSIEATAVNP